MKKLLVVICILFILVACGEKGEVVKEGAVEPICLVTLLEGEVFKNGESIAVGDNLGEEDTVRTGANSVLELQLGDSSLVRIKENSELKIVALFQEVESQSTKLFLKSGMLLANPEEQREGSSFEVETESVTLGVRGTEFVLVNDEAGTRVAVKSGKVTVKNRMNIEALERLKGFDQELALSLEKRITPELTVGADEKFELAEVELEAAVREISLELEQIAGELERAEKGGRLDQVVEALKEQGLEELVVRVERVVKRVAKTEMLTEKDGKERFGLDEFTELSPRRLELKKVREDRSERLKREETIESSRRKRAEEEEHLRKIEEEKRLKEEQERAGKRGQDDFTVADDESGDRQVEEVALVDEKTNIKEDNDFKGDEQEGRKREKEEKRQEKEDEKEVGRREKRLEEDRRQKEAHEQKLWEKFEQRFRNVHLAIQRGAMLEAIRLAEENVELAREETGEGHEIVAIALLDLADLYRGRPGRLAAAEELLEEALQIVDGRKFGPDGGPLGRLYTLYGEVKLERGDLKLAEEHFKKAIAISDRALERGAGDRRHHLRIKAQSTKGLADLFFENERFARSEEYYREALKLLEQVVPAESGELIFILEPYRELLQSQGKEQEARRIEDRIRRIEKR